MMSLLECVSVCPPSLAGEGAREGAVRRSLQLVCLLACCLELKLELKLVCLVIELDLDLVASERASAPHASYPPPPLKSRP